MLWKKERIISDVVQRLKVEGTHGDVSKELGQPNSSEGSLEIGGHGKGDSGEIRRYLPFDTVQVKGATL